MKTKGKFVRSSTAARRRWEATREVVPHRRRGDCRGSLNARVPRNEFLCTRVSYANFILRAECKLIGRPTAASGPFAARAQQPRGLGLQADMSADPDGGYWGCLYDESRRNRVLVRPDRAMIKKILKPTDWNQYEIRARGAEFVCISTACKQWISPRRTRSCRKRYYRFADSRRPAKRGLVQEHYDRRIAVTRIFMNCRVRGANR